MTSHPIPDNASCWWLVTGKWRRLHAVHGDDISQQEMRDAIDDNRRIAARAVCGLHRRWVMPGMFSRLGRPRCIPCCRTLGIPSGNGTPANEEARSR